MPNLNSLKVIIIGAGTGGLCLAQGLKASGIAVEVFERDRTPTDRLQGYRLSINAQGSEALKSCLPEKLFEQFVQGAAKPSESVTFLDHRLGPLLGLDLRRSAKLPAEREWPVSRTTLRRVLLEGLDSTIHFGKTCVGFTNPANEQIAARFEDGSVARGDVLVAADGASSRLRAQLLPHAKRIDTGIIAVSGKFTLDDAARARVPAPILRGPTLVLGPQGCFMFANAVLYEPRGGGTAEHEKDYVMWGFSAHREDFGFSAPPEAVNGVEARARVLELMDEWNPALRELVGRAELGAMSTFSVKTSVPISPWVTSNATLLGDALHNMTPFRGIGANTALRDAQSLHRLLVGVNRGEQALIPALAQYERDMIDYGFHAVRTSLKDMERFHAKSPLALGVTKTLFRTVDRVPLLKSAFLGR